MAERMFGIKFLTEGLQSTYEGTDYPLNTGNPGDWKPGDWVKMEGRAKKPKACERGIHMAQPNILGIVNWGLDDAMTAKRAFVMELEGPFDCEGTDESKVAGVRGRIICELTSYPKQRAQVPEWVNYTNEEAEQREITIKELALPVLKEFKRKVKAIEKAREAKKLARKRARLAKAA